MARKLPEKLAGKRAMGKDEKNEDEEEVYEDEVFNTEEGSMKSIPIPPRNYHKFDETEDGKPAGIPPSGKVPRKALPKEKLAEEKEGEPNLSSAKGIDASIRQTSAKKSVLQSAEKKTDNRKNAAERMNAPISFAGLLPIQTAGNRPKSTMKDSPKPDQSFTAAGKPKSASAKRKSVEDLCIAESKKKKEEKIAKIFGNIFDDSDEESEENAAMTIDGLIKRAEDIFEQTPDLLLEDKRPNEKQKEGIVKIVDFTEEIANQKKKSKGAGNETTPLASPIWSIKEDALKTLHGLQTLNIMLCDILGASVPATNADDADIMKALSIYMSKLEKPQMSDNCNPYLTCIFCIPNQIINYIKTIMRMLTLIKIWQ
jgi:hypothetical protein